MTVLLHPSYFPNISTFATMARYPVCWEVWDNYQKQTYRNRCYICTDQGRHMLSIPIKHIGGKHGRQLYRDVRLDNTYPWQRQHWRTLQTAYRASPFFEFFEADLEPLYTKKFRYLLDFNFHTIELICECLNITRPTQMTETYMEAETDMIDGRMLINAKKELQVDYKPYTQVFQDRHGFVPNLSILDLLFNEGNAANTYLQNLKLEWINA